jgi:hypothetical protein
MVYDEKHLDKFKNINPKHIVFEAVNIKLDKFKETLKDFNAAICTFNDVVLRIKKPEDFNLLSEF